MYITGIAEVIYGVDDLAECTAFFTDFGLRPLESSDTHSVFEVLNGSKVTLYTLGDARIPASQLTGQGVHECIWAVSEQAEFDALIADLRTDHEVCVDDSGVAHLVTDYGQAVGIKVFKHRPLTCSPSPTNAPGIINRMNTPRKWPTRAIPKTISHCVWAFEDVDQALHFYRNRLGFKVTDLQTGVGVYVRGGRSTNHHNVMIANAFSPAFGMGGKFGFHHANFGCEDMDEIMAGKNYLERQGRETGAWGLGRHRVSSELFLYMPSPAGGEVEYGADCDQVDEHWRPRVWAANFAAFTYMHNMPEFILADEPEWDVRYAQPGEEQFIPE
jgi:catechol 2,3-dioxygenase-like lactoylglutathione lyase family enzyme